MGDPRPAAAAGRLGTTGSCVCTPAAVRPNEEAAAQLDASAGWITQRADERGQRVSAVYETNVAMSASVEAAPGPAPGPQVELLAMGTTRETLSVTVDGPAEIAYRRISIQPGGFTGWHYHPGPAVAVVESGVLTRMFRDRPDEVSAAGDIVIEPAGPDHVHAGANYGSTPVVLYMAYFSPRGEQHTIATDPPAG